MRHDIAIQRAGLEAWRALLTPWPWALLCLAAAIAAALYFAFRVEIVHADVGELSSEGETLVIEGNNFREHQRNGYVLYEAASGQKAVLQDVRLWTDTRIEVGVSGHLSVSGSVRVVQTTPLWEWSSNRWPLGMGALDYPHQPLRRALDSAVPQADSHYRRGGGTA
jgi:hypothetical protein